MITIAVPAFNEEKRIRSAVESILAGARLAGDIEVEIVVVNDGSTDGTRAAIEELQRAYPQLRAVHHAGNLGFGEAFKSALRVARFGKISIFPGDNAISIDTIRLVLESHDKADIVVAYFVNTEVRSRFRHALSRAFNLIYRITFGVQLRYFQGSPVFPVGKLRSMRLRSQGYNILAEINVKLIKQGASFIEVAGHFNPGNDKSSAIRFKTLRQVVRSYLWSVYDVLILRRTTS